MREQMMDMYFRNYSLIPLKDNSKKPAIPWEPYIHRVPTYDEYNKWAKAGLFKTGYGVVTGSVSGISVLDVDFKHGGMESLAEKDIHIEDIITWTVDTPNGRHYYFEYDKRAKQGANRLGAGVDIRNDGGFVVGPGSTVEGNVYSWAHEFDPKNCSLAKAPSWLLQGPGNRIEKHLTDFSTRIRNGERNNKLASLGGTIIKTLSIKKVPFDLAKSCTYATLQYVNEHHMDSPLDDGEVQSIVKSVSRYYQKEEDV